MIHSEEPVNDKEPSLQAAKAYWLAFCLEGSLGALLVWAHAEQSLGCQRLSPGCLFQAGWLEESVRLCI